MTLPMDDYEINAPKLPERELAVVILDENFQKVGEYNLKEKSDRCSHVFVSPEGLHINVLSDDDDYMEFLTVTPKRL